MYVNFRNNRPLNTINLTQGTQNLKNNELNGEHPFFPKQTLGTKLDIINFENTPTLGGNFVYSKEDAIKKAWFKQNAISLDDINSGKKIEIPSFTPSQNFVKELEQNGISNEADFLYASLDFNSMSADKLKQSVDYMASRYSVMKEQINTNFTGEEKTFNLKRLDEMVDTMKGSLAKKFSEQVGNFFEENGVSGEKEYIYQSVLSEFDKKVAEYSDVIKSNQNYANINGTKDEWLKNDSAYMASELRKVTNGSTFEKAERSTAYTLDDLEKMKVFTDELNDYSLNIYGSGKKVNAFGTEEEIGMQLSEVILKGYMFNKHADASERVKESVNKSIENFVGRSINEVQNHINYQIYIKGSNIPNDVRKGLASIDKDAIYAVINKVKSTYESTGDIYKSLLDGALFAKNQHNEKSQSNKYNGIYRYEQNTYWNNFFKNTDKSLKMPDILGIARPNNGYIQQESGIDSMISSWNKFADKVTSDSSAKLSNTYFSMYA